MQENHFDEPIAARYDDDSASMFDDDVLGPTIERLTELADGGPVLEFAVGTGRIALPLSECGHTVHGIELSTAMADRLLAKPGADRVEVTIGDIATTRVDATFSLVVLVFNTVMNLTTQDRQVACFLNAAAHLRRGGRFVVEVMVPDLQRLPPGETVHPFHIGADHLGFDEYEVVSQGLISHHVSRDGDVWTRSSTPFRYVWPAELDLMATIAGMTLEHRWADWDGAPFVASSRSHVSVWRKPVDDR